MSARERAGECVCVQVGGWVGGWVGECECESRPALSFFSSAPSYACWSVSCSGLAVWDLGFGLWGVGFGVWGLGLGAEGLEA